MFNALNGLYTSDTAHGLKDNQKIAKFESGFKVPNSINFLTQAESMYDSLPVGKTFDNYSISMNFWL